MLRRYVEPEIGAKLLRDVRRTDVQRVIDRMPHHADGEITVGTIKHCYRAMRTALKAGDLRVDPTKSIELPESMEPGRDWPSADEVARILTGGSRHHLAPGDRVPRLQRVSSRRGDRPSGRAVDLNAGVVHIRVSGQWVNGELFDFTPKNKKAPGRDAPAHAHLGAALMARARPRSA